LAEPGVVEFRNVSKKFVLHHDRARSFQEVALGLFRPRSSREDLWALDDVSFEVRPGQSLAIIGENGSGKSTALKLMAGILRPTQGSIAVGGRLAALLELGAGFHPDLTGRENLYLNASVLGFSRKEIESRVPDIVAFSELERFLDTPLKHYSSGMQIRLGFAIAISSDPDVLLTDEVLAVGDEAFQNTSMDRIDELLRQGKTLVFVSHQLDQVQAVCSEAVWLDHGRVRSVGRCTDVVAEYLDYANRKARARTGPSAAEANPDSDFDASRRWGTREAEITRVELLDANGQPTPAYDTGAPMLIRIHYHAHEPIASPNFGLAIYFGEHIHVSGPSSRSAGFEIDEIRGEGYVDFRVKSLPLLKGMYLLTVAIYDQTARHAYDHHDRLYPFRVQQSDAGERYGMVWLDADWDHRATPSRQPIGA
jgi:lipopolysaccharide transport system ATP-binding protein